MRNYDHVISTRNRVVSDTYENISWTEITFQAYQT